MPDSLFLEERRRAILERLKLEGRVAVKDLSERMQVSAVTIRQDLRALEEAGLLERTYGGAVFRSGQLNLQELSFNARQLKHRPQKEAIAQAAAALLQDGYSLALDSSSTAYALVPHLRRFDRITVVTNSLVIAESFLDSPGIRVLMPGGRLRHDSISLVGNPESLPKVNLNIGFFGARGMDEVAGASEIDPDEVAVKQALIARCVCSVFVVDGSKWGQVAAYTLMAPHDLTHIITSADAPPDLVSRFRQAGVRVDVISFAGNKAPFGAMTDP
jgi:DeoR/GlpR family transcriptional regulator of sugar metabolism